MLFDDTKLLNAHFYLDDTGHETTKDKFMRECFCDDYKGYMFYIGSGHVPLVVAALAWDVSDARQVMEEWARKTGRNDDIGEDDDWERLQEDAFQKERAGESIEYPEPQYELIVQFIPKPRLVMP